MSFSSFVTTHPEMLSVAAGDLGWYRFGDGCRK